MMEREECPGRITALHRTAVHWANVLHDRHWRYATSHSLQGLRRGGADLLSVEDG
jgi:hypothetical protein